MGRPKLVDNPSYLAARIPEQLHCDLLALAKERGVNVSIVVRWALTQYLQSEKEQKHEQ